MCMRIFGVWGMLNDTVAHGLINRKKEMFDLTTHSTHFIYRYMKGRKEMFDLMTHSTHYIYHYTEGRKEGNV